MKSSYTAGRTEEKSDELLSEEGSEEELSLPPPLLSPLFLAAPGYVLPFADPVMSRLQHSCDGVGDGGPA